MEVVVAVHSQDAPTTASRDRVSKQEQNAHARSGPMRRLSRRSDLVSRLYTPSYEPELVSQKLEGKFTWTVCLACIHKPSYTTT